MDGVGEGREGREGGWLRDRGVKVSITTIPPSGNVMVRPQVVTTEKGPPRPLENTV